jgi:hypothetical protein
VVSKALASAGCATLQSSGCVLAKGFLLLHGSLHSVASVVGTLKFLTGVSIKPFIAGSLLPTVGLACYMQW